MNPAGKVRCNMWTNTNKVARRLLQLGGRLCPRGARYRQAEAVDGQHLVESFEDAGGDTGRLLIKPAGEIPQQPLGFIGIVELPSLPEHPAYRCMQRLGQPLDHVAGFMNLGVVEKGSDA